MSRNIVTRILVLVLLTATSLVGVGSPAHAAGGPAHSLAQARKGPLTSVNQWQRHTLARHSQQNWYRIFLRTDGYVSALLGTLPANYNLALYNSVGSRIGAADAKGRHFEDVSRKLRGREYFVRVASTSGASTKSTYTLNIRFVPLQPMLSALSARMGDRGSVVVGELINTSGKWLTMPYADVSFYDGKGKLLRRFREMRPVLSGFLIIPPGRRAPYAIWEGHVSSTVRKAVKRITVTPRVAILPARPSVASLTFSSVRRHREVISRNSYTVFTATMTNRTKRRLGGVEAVAVLYDQAGIPVRVDGDFPEVWSLAAGAKRSVSVQLVDWLPRFVGTLRGYEITDTSPDPIPLSQSQTVRTCSCF